MVVDFLPVNNGASWPLTRRCDTLAGERSEREVREVGLGTN